MAKKRSGDAGDLFEAGDSAPRATRLSVYPSTRPAFTVTELAQELRIAAERATGQVWVKGEVIGLKVYEAGHWYFTLRDAESQLRCVMWRTYAQRQKTEPPEGTEVYVLATPTVWTQRGDLRLAAVTMLPTAGVGFQQLSFERTREQLERDGLLDPARKRPLPPFPRVIAVITSPDGVVLQDILTVARRRWPATRIVLVPAKVQGDEAVDELVRAVGVVNRLGEIEICILARGGGARDDLLAFNAEPVCRAVAGSRVPTISAVGHETDVTLTDLVADLRAPTPTAAAAMALPDRSEVARHVGALGNRLAQGLRSRTTLAAERLARLGDRAHASLSRRVEIRRREWERLGASLHALSPLAVMNRGYSIAQRTDGGVIKRREQVSSGDAFSVRVTDGTIPARVE